MVGVAIVVDGIGVLVLVTDDAGVLVLAVVGMGVFVLVADGTGVLVAVGVGIPSPADWGPKFSVEPLVDTACSL